VRRRLGALVVVLAAAQTAAAGAATITAEPTLKPSFRTSIPDYTLRCRTGDPVRLTVDPPDGRPFTRSVDLAPGRAAAVRFHFAKRTRRYRIRCLPEGFPSWRARRYQTPEAGWYLVTPNQGPSRINGPGYAVMFDSHGVPVWWIARSPSPFAADLLPNGNVVWTNWVALSPESDAFVERTLTGKRRRSFATVGSSTNQHDFKLLPNGNALLITYPSRDGVDLSRYGGPKDAIVLDGEIQEVDPAGNLVWSWNSKDHMKLAEVEVWLRRQIANPTIKRWDGKPVYDLVHINSVEPDGPRLIFSSRYSDAVYAIRRATGGIVWKLGGTHTPRSLAIHGDPLASRGFGGQHDARLVEGGSLLTLFDNGTYRERPPRAVAFQLDLEHRSARLVGEVRFSEAPRSVCCGGARLLPGRNWVASWGNQPWVTEQTWRGDPVLTIEFRGPHLASYRAIPIMRDQLTRDRLSRAMRIMYGG
jgi:hypothetical protein